MPHEIIHQTGARRDEVYFWALHPGSERDFMIVCNSRRLGFEFKLTHSPKVTPSMRSVQEALGLDHLYLARHGEGEAWPLAQGINLLSPNTLYSVSISA